MVLLFKHSRRIQVKAYGRKNGRRVSAHMRSVAQYAASKHRGQTRKDGKTPYITHPISVAGILYTAGVHDEDTLAAAILHDTLEELARQYIVDSAKWDGNRTF